MKTVEIQCTIQLNQLVEGHIMSKTRKILIAIVCLIVFTVAIVICLNISAKKAFELATDEALEKSQTIRKKIWS